MMKQEESKEPNGARANATDRATYKSMRIETTETGSDDLIDHNRL